MLKDFLRIWKYNDMIKELTHRELRGKYKGSVLGFLWTYINPMAQIVVYYFFFSMVLRSGIEKFHLYLIVSMFPWNFFTGGVLQGLMSVRTQGDLVKKTFFPRQILPIVSVIVNFINMLISFIIIYSVLLMSGWGIDMSLQAWLVPVMLAEFMFTLGLALLFAGVEVYFRDIEHIISVIMMIWMYVTPMFYSLDIVPEELQKFFLFNPMLYIISMYQRILYYKVAPGTDYMVRAVIISLCTFVIGWIVFHKLEKRFAEEL